MIINDLYKVAMLSAAWIIIFEHLNPVYASVYAIGILLIVGHILIRNFTDFNDDSTNIFEE